MVMLNNFREVEGFSIHDDILRFQLSNLIVFL